MSSKLVKFGMYLPRYPATTYSIATVHPITVYLPTEEQCSQFHKNLLARMEQKNCEHYFTVLKNVSYFTDQKRLDLCDVIIDQVQAKVTYLKQENVDFLSKYLLSKIKKPQQGSKINKHQTITYKKTNIK